MIVALLAAVLDFSVIHAAEVVPTDHPQRDVIIAEKALTASADSRTLQSAIDDVAQRGGGTVFLCRGTYTIDAPVTVKRGVTLRGDYDPAHPADSTVLAIVCGAGEEDGPAAFSLEHGSGLVGLVFHYPNQSLAKPIPYPWTVRSHLRHAGNNQTIDDCTFVNSWRAIAIGPETNECHTFRRLKICALKTGFFIDMTTDIGRVYEVTLSPSVWTSSGFPGAPREELLTTYLKSSGAVAADYARSDWEFIRGLSVDGYHIGIRFHLGKSPVGMNGVMAACRIANCDQAVVTHELNEVGLAVYDSTFAGNVTNLVCSPKFNSVALFHSSRFTGGPLVLGPQGTVGLRACTVDCSVDASAGGRLMRDDAPASGVVRYEPMAFARPQGGKVVFAKVDPNAEDCTAAIQAALDAAAGTGASPLPVRSGAGDVGGGVGDIGSRSGDVEGGAFGEGTPSSPQSGTVYLPAGIYRCRGTLTVPSGVELRGASAVPHHTMSGGTVLFVYGGRGETEGMPFCSLEAGSGLRGLSFWYPEQDVGEPVAYPWTVRALGAGCWMTDVNIANSWQGADFATHPSDGHRISYFSGGFYRTGLTVGSCATTGWVEDVQMNTHYVYRRPANHPLKEPRGPQRGEPPFMLYQRDWLQGLVFENCADERIAGTFLYAARDGIVFNGKMKATVMIHGTDTGCRAFTLKTEPGSSVCGALVQLVALGRQVESSIAVQEGNAGDLTLFATQFWPRYPLLEQYGTGKTTLDQFNGVAGPVKVRSGSAEVIGGIFRHPLAVHVESGAAAAVTCRGCIGERNQFNERKDNR